ncbi:RNA polymerase sigma factor, sigma-70 family [Amphibacillus marinus]|uniref:RNA polymerase sigma factor, sigma-70 family n=1 Tax=Amphibacillus marinus TaxID=872970 RepID=A0A1H8NW15_9BACI|nr:RNA polymerase sigma factor, sigma-70 family [Amphibacillus marinus]
MHLRSIKKTKKDVSLQDPIGQDKEGNEISLIDILQAENDDIVDFIQLNLEVAKISKYLSILDNREKLVLMSRYGLGMAKERTQKEIARDLNISRSYVSRIEKRALMKIFHEYYRQEK